MLVVFKREDKSLYRKCLNCQFFVELKDDENLYPKTVGVVCNAPQTVMMTCFRYDWFRATGHYKSETVAFNRTVKTVDLKPAYEVLKRLKKLGVKK